MYALAVNGSPRKGGNTELLLKAVLAELEEAGWETELEKVGGTAIRGCFACDKCFKNKDGACANNQDAFNDIYQKMLRADAMILGAPTYFAAIPADLKALIERAGYVAFANDQAFSAKIGAAVVAVRRGGATHVYDTINHMFQMSRMVSPCSTYWNMGFGLQEGDVLEDAEGMANMRHLGKAIDWLGKAIAPHKDTYPKA
jgi:multimeric flavodoxin WrbA